MHSLIYDEEVRRDERTVNAEFDQYLASQERRPH